jgi:hypothetical protein
MLRAKFEAPSLTEEQKVLSASVMMCNTSFGTKKDSIYISNNFVSIKALLQNYFSLKNLLLDCSLAGRNNAQFVEYRLDQLMKCLSCHL